MKPTGVASALRPGPSLPVKRHQVARVANKFSLIGNGRGEARSNGRFRPPGRRQRSARPRAVRARASGSNPTAADASPRVVPGGQAHVPGCHGAGPRGRTGRCPPPATSPIRCTPRPPASRWRVEPYAVGGGAASEALGGGVGRGAGLVARQRPANRQSLLS